MTTLDSPLPKHKLLTKHGTDDDATFSRCIDVSCCCCVVVVALRPRYTSKVMSGLSVNLTTLFLGRFRPPKRLTSTLCTYFRQ